MHLLANTRVRLFLVCWVIYSLFFSTNVVREHYPAFAFLDHGNFRCDEYAGFHADIFEHTDGHSYINSNVTAGVLAAIPLFIFDPLLDKLEAYSKEKLAASGGEVDTGYDTKYKNRREMFRKVKLAGKDLRFGAVTAITSVFLMAPLCALCVVWLFTFMLARGMERSRALWLAWLFAFGTPIFYRASHLSHNTLLMVAALGAFMLLWCSPDEPYDISLVRRLGAGFLCGLAFALDYSGAIPAAVLWFYFVFARASASPFKRVLGESVAIVVGALPWVAVLMWAQWSQFGDPFTPAQFVMKNAEFTAAGMRGMGLPTLEIFLKNLLTPGWGMYAFCPVLLLALWPSAWIVGSRFSLYVPTRERRMFAALVLLFLLFCAGNYYSLMQFNTGFRYLMPILPFVFLQASDALARMGKRTLLVLTVVSVAHSAVMCMTREVNDTEKDLRARAAQLNVAEHALPGYWNAMLTETPIPVAYRRIAREGVQLPWLTVLGQTSKATLLKGSLLPSVIIVLSVFGCAALWMLGERKRNFSSTKP